MNAALLVGILLIWALAVSGWLAIEVYRDRKEKMRTPGYTDYVAKAREFEAGMRSMADIKDAIMAGKVIWSDDAGRVHLDERPRWIIGSEWAEEHKA